MNEPLNTVIIGSGPAGYTAAIYCARAGLAPVMATGVLAPGGQLVNTSEVENYPGFPEGILGPELMDRMKEQASRFGTTMLSEDVESVAPVHANHDATLAYDVTMSDGSILRARTVIITTGSVFRKLGIPGEAEYSGHGVSYCATCDGFFFRDKPIVVVGGGDSAFEEALFLTRFGSSVTLIHRRDTFRASHIMVKRAQTEPKLTLLTNTVVTAIRGTTSKPATVSPGATSSKPSLTLNQMGGSISLPGATTTAEAPTSAISLAHVASSATPAHVTDITIRDTETNEERTLKTAAVFVAIGHTPATDFLGNVVHRDSEGYILTEGGSTLTSSPGIFAAGDCTDRTYRQAISAAGMGCRAALDAQAYLSDIQS